MSDELVAATAKENRRQALHAATTLLALVLRFLTHNEALAMAVVGVVLGWVVFPLLRWDRALRREHSPWLDGVKLYPLAVLALVLVFDDLAVVAAAWAVLGIGDAASNVFGRRFGRPGFLGRAGRSAVGTAAFVLTAAPAAIAAYLFVAGGHPASGVAQLGSVALAATAAAIAGAAVELLVPAGYDDNFAIALTASAAFAFTLSALG